MSPDRERLDELRIDRGDPGGRSWAWVPIVLVLLLAVAGGIYWLARPASARVETAVAREVTLGGATAVLNASGYVTARRQATVSSKVTGKVVEVLIEEGMEVAEGQVLARLDAANVERSLRLAEAQQAAAAAALGETRARLAQAALDLERMRSLQQEAVSSRADLDRAATEATALEARLAAQLGQEEVARRQVALERQALEDTVIRAPFAGRVVDKAAQPGEMISPISAGGGFTRTGIGTIVDMASLEVEVDVNESYINRVTAGQPVEAVLDAYPDWTIPAHVIAIIPTADRDKATVRVRIGFEALDPRMLPEMGIKVRFLGRPEESATPAVALLVPRAALRSQEGQDVVLVVRDGRVERRAVKVSESRDGDVVVAAGLAAGERVVVVGPAELADGDPVEEVGQ